MALARFRTIKFAIAKTSSGQRSQETSSIQKDVIKVAISMLMIMINITLYIFIAVVAFVKTSSLF